MTHCYFLISRSSNVLQTFISNCWLIQVFSNDLQFYEKPFQCLYCVRMSRATLPAKPTRVNYLFFFFLGLLRIPLEARILGTDGPKTF